MKAFEEWWNENKDRMLEWVHPEDFAREVWKAALEWTLSQRGLDHWGHPANNVQTDIIEKELEDA